jgi:hypothetical protein
MADWLFVYARILRRQNYRSEGARLLDRACECCHLIAKRLKALFTA